MKHTGFLMALLCLSSILYAGDAEISIVNFRSVFYIEDEKSVDITFDNFEAFDVTGLSLSAKIYFQSGPSTWDVVWQWDKEDLTVSANSSLEVSSDPNYFTPTLPGLYQLYISSYSSVDIDLSNNNYAKDFLVGNYQKISIKQFNLINPIMQERSTFGAIGFKLPPNDGVRFVNVVAQKPGTSNDAWLVQNLPVLPFMDTRTTYYYFDYEKLGYAPGDEINDLDIAVKESDYEISAKFDVYGFLNHKVWNIDYDVLGDNEKDQNEEVVHSILDELGDLPIPLFGDVYSIDYEYIGCEMPNIQLDSSSYGITNEYAGDLNACAPAAAANSMQWFENTLDEFPQTGLSHREKLEEMSRLMKRADGEGVITDDFIKGKLAYIDKYKLPIRVSYQGWWNQGDSIPSPDTTYGHYAENMSDSVNKQKAPVWDYLKEEVKKGADVELSFGWYDNSATRHGGHCVVVTGVSETNYAKGIYIKDDWDQKDSTRAIGETYLNWVTNDAGTFSRLVGFDGPNNTCWVESVVSEVYDPTVTFNTPGDEPSGIPDQTVENRLTTFALLNNSDRLGEDAILQFSLAEASMLKIEIYSMQGVLVSNFSFGTLGEGEHTKVLPGNLISNPGNYYVVILLDLESHLTKMIRY